MAIGNSKGKVKRMSIVLIRSEASKIMDERSQTIETHIL